MKLKKGDQIMMIAGKDRGKKGIIEKVLPTKEKIVITGLNIVKRHLKPSRKNPQGGILNKPAPVNASNAAIVCKTCSKPSRVGYKVTSVDKSDKKKNRIRICKKCKESLD